MMKNKEMSRRELLVDALSLGLFAGAGAAGLFQPSYALGDLPGRMPKGQSIYKLSGEVVVDGQLANIQTQVGPNSHVRTGNNSQVIFVVASDAFLLRSNSELKFGAQKTIVSSIRAVSGAILGVFGRRESTLELNTTTATIGIRGTGVYVETDPVRSYVCTCYGHTQISANADPEMSENIVTQKHNRPVYVSASETGQGLIVPAPTMPTLINHKNDELALIEALVGRTAPFGRKGGYKI